MRATLELSQAEDAPKTSESAGRGRHPLLLAIPAILLALALILPFLNKAFAIDDPMNLLAAQHATRDFWHPLGFNLCWDAPSVCRPAQQIIPNALLIVYFLLPASWFGSPEWLVHLMQFGALCLGIAATVSIALRLGCNRLEASLAGLLAAAFPPVIAYANGATPDVLAMALGAAGIERLLLWRTTQSASTGVAAGVLLGMAPLARVHMVLLLPLALLVVGWRMRRSWPMAISAALFAAGFIAGKGGGHDIAPVAGRLMSTEHVGYNSVSYLWYLVMPFPLGLAWLAGMGRRGIAVTLAIVAAFLALTRLGRVNPWVSLIALSAICAAIALVAIFGKAIRERTSDLLFLTGWLITPLCAVFYTHLPPKYLIGCSPAIAILMILLLRRNRFAAIWAGTLIACCAVLSWLTLRADSEFAGKARVAAEELVRPNAAAGQNVWFTGEWGIAWYAQRAGARTLQSTGPQPSPGDFLLVGAEGAAAGLEQRFPRRTLVARRRYVSTVGRTMNHDAGAGLHSNVVGLFVWVPSNGYLDSYELWRID